MRDLLSWSFSLWRLRGITVRVHIFFLLFMLVMVGRGVIRGYGPEALLLQVLLFVSVLLHEYGHCFAARRVDGDANDILMWPLGGLASVDVPNTPRAHFITAAGGPIVNLLIFLGAGTLLLAVYGILPPMNPLWDPVVVWVKDTAKKELIGVTPGALWDFARASYVPFNPETNIATSDLGFLPATLARIFWVNWILFWFNVLLVGFPLDGGRMLQCILWPSMGFTRATQTVIFTGYAVAVVLGVYSFITLEGESASSKLLLLSLAFFIYVTCRQQSFLLESGQLADESTFGYDFSQGYTSLERDQPAPRRPRVSWWQRWLQRRAARKRQRDDEQRAADERRMDELLAKVAEGGLGSLTDEERRFLTRVSAKYRNRN